MTIVYRLIIILAIALITTELFSQKNLSLKLNAGLVLIPLLMRAMMIA